MRYTLILSIIFATVCCNHTSTESDHLKTKTAIQNRPPEGNYILIEDGFNLTDSITITHDSLIVYADEIRGFGSIFEFVYSFKVYKDRALVLHGLTHRIDGQARKMFASVEEFDWHGDTIQFKIEQNGDAVLLPPDDAQYKLNRTKPKLPKYTD